MPTHYIVNMVLYMHLDCILLHMYHSERYEVGDEASGFVVLRVRVLNFLFR